MVGIQMPVYGATPVTPTPTPVTPTPTPVTPTPTPVTPTPTPVTPTPVTPTPVTPTPVTPTPVTPTPVAPTPVAGCTPGAWCGSQSYSCSVCSCCPYTCYRDLVYSSSCTCTVVSGGYYC